MNTEWFDKWFEVKEQIESLANAVDELCYTHDCDECPLDNGKCEVYSANRHDLEFIAKIVAEGENG